MSQSETDTLDLICFFGKKSQIVKMIFFFLHAPTEDRELIHCDWSGLQYWLSPTTFL